MTLGRRIKKLRKERKMSQSELTEGFLTKGMLSLIENDKSTPSMETLTHIANKLDVAVSYLTQEGDEQWTNETYEMFEDYDSLFSLKKVEEILIPNIDRIYANEQGAILLTILRSYYRFKQRNGEADQLHEEILSKFNKIGLKHLAMRELLNHAISKMFAYEYQEGLDTLHQYKDEILNFSEYDPRLEISYYYIESLLSAAVEEYDLMISSVQKVETLSFKHLSFTHYFEVMTLIVNYYIHSGEDELKQQYVKKIKDFLQFAPDIRKEIEIMDENQIYPKYFLIGDTKKGIERLNIYIDKLRQAINSGVVKETEWIELFLKLNEIELQFLKGEYETVINEFNLSYYEVRVATHPADRIQRQIRSLAYALSLKHLGRIKEAKSEIERVERTLGPLIHSMYAEEFHIIKQMIEEDVCVESHCSFD